MGGGNNLGCRCAKQTGFDETCNERMRGRRRGCKLWDEQGADEKRVLSQFDHVHCSLLVRADNTQRSGSKSVNEIRVDTKVTEILLMGATPPVETRNQGTGLERDCHAAPHQGTGQARYEQPRGVWRSLLVLGVSKTQHIPGILQNDVLEAPASAEKRNSALACDADGRQSSFHTFIRTGWSNPNAAERRQPALRARPRHLLCANPAMLDLRTDGRQRMADGVIRSDMRFIALSEITDHGYWL